MASASTRSIGGSTGTGPSPPCRRCGPSNVASAYLYYDAQTDDARLTLCLARTAAAHGAAVANRVAVVGLWKDARGAVRGATVRADGDEFEVQARTVVNATGVSADDVRTLDEGADPDSIRPAKGVHVAVPWSKVRNEIAAIVPVPRDRRSVFVVPWGDFTYVGTTDTDYDGPVDDPQCTPATSSTCFGGEPGGHGPDHRRRCHRHVGRPAAAAAHREQRRTADLSRRHGVRVSASDVITVTGGKLTTYRRMAVDHGRPSGPHPPRPPQEPHSPARAARLRRLRAVARDRGAGQHATSTSRAGTAPRRTWC